MIDITGGKGYNGQKVPLCQKDINGSDTEIYHCGDDSGKVHLFSYRTQKLSLLAPKILNWRRFGKIGSCCIQNESIHQKMGAFHFVDASNYRSRPDNRADCVREEVESLNCYMANDSGSKLS